MGNMLVSPTSNVVNNQTRNITPTPIMNPSSPYGPWVDIVEVQILMISNLF